MSIMTNAITHCCGRSSQVTDSRVTGTTRRRRRKCPKCKSRWTTYEMRGVSETLARSKITQAMQQVKIVNHHLATVTQHLADVLEAIEYSDEDDDD